VRRTVPIWIVAVSGTGCGLILDVSSSEGVRDGSADRADVETLCPRSMADCDRDPSNGCETPIDSVTECGGCGLSCDLDNAITRCRDERCGVAGCLSGFGDCDGRAHNGCERILGTPTDCGTCEDVCSPGLVCAAGRCVEECPLDTMNCGGSCVNVLTSLVHCGRCGAPCGGGSHTVATCLNGACDVRCEPGWFDRNDDPLDGCEGEGEPICGPLPRFCTAATPCSCSGACNCALVCAEECELTCADADTTCAVAAVDVSNVSQVTCELGAQCVLDATDAGNVMLSCSDPGTSCAVNCLRVSNCTHTCSAGARCETDCDFASNCFVECSGSAECIIRNCATASNCVIGCDVAVTICPGNVRVCNRPCP